MLRAVDANDAKEERRPSNKRMSKSTAEKTHDYVPKKFGNPKSDFQRKTPCITILSLYPMKRSDKVCQKDDYTDSN